ncbi:ADP-ribosyl cyclase/cyclic ADP-ribose hydrolase 1 isoform X1 [Varanus komodoensis]|uniref:ADP-ribosyl cyclase/cyclic ADP-ribose hydrolase 1 isoform X1 n=1 Tax=Varanus komodoensis TaxID=61221 RepID=UPI001CF79284|nr:ADP-ribosyl cyclase/cyclic ADP-ribose hydrolase 1 isoform X1 [Varanus komodoensis]XP_044274295.1 ADP-ribosyl cyclase/cyclic ADP-ribose hydrolase 1 isoform X1 [Varanus komodoensis]
MPFQSSSTRTARHRWILTGFIVLLVMLVVIVVVVAFQLGKKESTSSEVLQWKGKGTTEQLREIILGRCYNYIATINPDLRDKDCIAIWDMLEHAFMYKHPCNATEKDYQPMMDVAHHSIPCNKVTTVCAPRKSLFWSKTNDLVHRYTKATRNYFTLEDTLPGYIADGLSWCGNPSSPGINYNSCPKWTECENNPSSIYWKMASKMFAEAACGTVQVMLNGSIGGGAYRDNSILGSVEMVNLNPDKISKVQIWLMHDIDGPQSESCMGHSVTKLKEILERRKISVSCKDNYRPVQLLQCTNNPDHAACRACS